MADRIEKYLKATEAASESYEDLTTSLEPVLLR